MVIQQELVFKEFGKDFAAQKNHFILATAQQIAKELARFSPISIEEVREEMERRKIEYEPGNWLGSVFKGKEWSFTGEWRKATHKGSHARPVRVWRLK